MDITGWRTVIAAIVGGPLSALSVKFLGAQLDPATQLFLVGAIMTGLMTIMRVLTKTPIGSSVPLPAVAQFPNTTFPTAEAAKTAQSITKMVGAVIVALLVGTAGAQLTACAALGITKPLTFNEKLASGYATTTAVLVSTDQLLRASVIKSAVAVNIEKQDANIKEALDIAAQVNASDAKDGANQLTAALTAINALSAYLSTLSPPAK